MSPGLRRLRLVLLLVIVIALAGGSLTVWALTTPTFQVRHIHIIGTSDSALLATIRTLPLAGCAAFRCDVRHDIALLEALPAVERADVWVAYPDMLVVRVTPRVPLLLWRIAGQPYLAAADGTLIAQADAHTASVLPAVDDPQGAALGGADRAHAGARLPRPLVGMAAQLLNGLPGALGDGAALAYDADVGLVADDGHGLRVAFGDPARPPGAAVGGVSGQLAELRAILALLARHGQTADWIDLRWGTHPAYHVAGT
jgi:hypothetical protein